MNKLFFLHLKNHPIFDLLQLEEALVRLENNNYCIINEGTPPSIVMGISSKPSQVIEETLVYQKQIPTIRRFSGGGCVFVDEKTVFVTFIFQKNALPIHPFPEPILQWTEEFFRASFKIPSFALRENDFVIGMKKCGGNAQYIRKDQWLHHTSFLWDYHPENMNYLRFPPKVPLYRNNRSHQDFLTPLKNLLRTKQQLIDGMIQELKNRFEVEMITLEEVENKKKLPHRKSVALLNPKNHPIDGAFCTDCQPC